MTKILEFPKSCVILGLDPRISSHRHHQIVVIARLWKSRSNLMQNSVIAEIPSLRGSKATEAISRNSKIPQLLLNPASKLLAKATLPLKHYHFIISSNLAIFLKVFHFCSLFLGLNLLILIIVLVLSKISLKIS